MRYPKIIFFLFLNNFKSNKKKKKINKNFFALKIKKNKFFIGEKNQNNENNKN
jgi:hypothetical protein